MTAFLHHARRKEAHKVSNLLEYPMASFSRLLPKALYSGNNGNGLQLRTTMSAETGRTC